MAAGCLSPSRLFVLSFLWSKRKYVEGGFDLANARGLLPTVDAIWAPLYSLELACPVERSMNSGRHVVLCGFEGPRRGTPACNYLPRAHAILRCVPRSIDVAGLEPARPAHITGDAKCDVEKEPSDAPLAPELLPLAEMAGSRESQRTNTTAALSDECLSVLVVQAGNLRAIAETTDVLGRQWRNGGGRLRDR